MESKIKEVHDYFKDKICNGEYEVVKRGDHVWDVMVDEKYKFILWIANDGINFSTYDGSFIQLELIVKDRLKAWTKIKKLIKEWEQTTQKREKIKQFNKLKKELGL